MGTPVVQLEQGIHDHEQAPVPRELAGPGPGLGALLLGGGKTTAGGAEEPSKGSCRFISGGIVTAAAPAAAKGGGAPILPLMAAAAAGRRIWPVGESPVLEMEPTCDGCPHTHALQNRDIRGIICSFPSQHMHAPHTDRAEVVPDVEGGEDWHSEQRLHCDAIGDGDAAVVDGGVRSAVDAVVLPDVAAAPTVWIILLVGGTT